MTSASARHVSTRILVDDLDAATAAWAPPYGFLQGGRRAGRPDRAVALRGTRGSGTWGGYSLELVEVSRDGEVWRRRDGIRRHSIGAEIEDVSCVSAALEARGYPAVVRGNEGSGRSRSFMFHASRVGGVGLRLTPISAEATPMDTQLSVYHIGTVVDDLPRALSDLSQVFGLGFAVPLKMAGELRGSDGPTYRETLLSMSLPGRRVTGSGEPADRPHHIAFHADPKAALLPGQEPGTRQLAR